MYVLSAGVGLIANAHCIAIYPVTSAVLTPNVSPRRKQRPIMIDEVQKLLMLIVKETCDKVARNYAIEALAVIERSENRKKLKGK